MNAGSQICRREFGARCVAGGLAVIGATQRSLFAQEATSAARSGIVNVVVFSNFEGQAQNPQPIIRWFDGCTQAHPSIRWTHMYSPRQLLVEAPDAKNAATEFNAYLRESHERSAAEIGLHIHVARRFAIRRFPRLRDDCGTIRRLVK